MPSQKDPEQKSTTTPPDTPDEGAAQPTEGELYRSSLPPAPEEAAPDEDFVTDLPEDADLEELEQLLGSSLLGAQAMAADYYEKASQAARDLGHQAGALAENSKAYAGAHPSQSLLGAFAVGLLIGWLSAR